MRHIAVTKCFKLYRQLLCRTSWLSHCYCYSLGLLHNFALISLEVVILTIDLSSDQSFTHLNLERSRNKTMSDSGKADVIILSLSKLKMSKVQELGQDYVARQIAGIFTLYSVHFTLMLTTIICSLSANMQYQFLNFKLVDQTQTWIGNCFK